MVSKEEFLELIYEYKLQKERLDKLEEIGLSLWDTDLIEYGNRLFEKLIEAIFTKEGSDHVFWWIYEMPFITSPAPHMWDEEGNPISMKTEEDLWEFVKDFRK